MSTMSINGANVAVVGGGVVGLAAACALSAADPTLTVVVYEQAECVSGATGYAGAIDIPYAPTPLHQKLVRSSRAWWERAATRGSTPTGGIGDGRAPWPRVPLRIAWLLRDPALAGHLHDALLSPVQPWPNAALADGAWCVPEGTIALAGNGHVIDPGALCAMLRTRLVATGRGWVLEGTRVAAVTSHHGSARLQLDGGRTFDADACVVAVGPWLPGLTEPLGPWATRQGVRTKRVFGLRFILEPSATAHFAVGSIEDGIFFFPVGDDEYAMSVRHDVWDVAPVELKHLSHEVTARAAHFLDALIGPGRWHLTRTRVFADTYTADAMPMVRRCPDADGNVFVVTGLHGSGVRLAPGLAAVVAEKVLKSLPETTGEST